MSKKSWLEEFNINSLMPSKHYGQYKSDYEVFEDKELLDQFRNKIIQELIDSNIKDVSKLTDYIKEEIERITDGYNLTTAERDYLYNLIENEVNGYGPITELLEDKNVTEIMVNGPGEIYIEVDGILLKDNSVSFINKEHIMRTIQRIIQPLGRTIDSTNPMVDSRLPDGSRINAIIPPLAVKGPVMTIRKFKDDIDTLDVLVGNGTLTPYMARFLDAAVQGKLNILVCGGTGSGKTTLLNVLSNCIRDEERIITIEDAVELKLKQSHVVSLETKNVNYDQKGEITIRDLVRNSLRMRPDRIIVGEVRGKEAFDMLQAMNTGHDGSLTTLHANSVADGLARLETMILMGEIELPVKAIRGYIASAIDLVVSIERLSDGRRKVTSIAEISDFDGEDIKLKEIFGFIRHGLTESGEVNGEFILHEGVPKVYEKMKSRGISTVDDMFEKNLKRNQKREDKNKS